MQHSSHMRLAAFWSWLLFVGLLGVFVFKGSAMNAPSVAYTKAVTGFDTDTAIARLTRILGDERPHPVDSDANDDVRRRLLAEVQALGYNPVVRDDFVCRQNRSGNGAACARVKNVLFRVGPVGRGHLGDGAALVASHYDSVAAGPGAADDGAGVASALEIAAQLRAKKLVKPVIFLFTDGEEAGLLGAASFIRSDPWAKDVGFVVNMEARGTGGPAIMFQTSGPNSIDISALAARNPRIIANSLAADIYRILPNDTDATEFLAVGWHVLNFAFISPLARYHTPNDSLAYLEHASVGHLGGAALSSVLGWLDTKPEAIVRENSVIYSDIWGHGLVVLPQWAGYLFIILGLLSSLLVRYRAPRKDLFRSIVAAPLGILVALVVAQCGIWVIRTLQSEVDWWTLMPNAARVLVYGAALLGATIALLICHGIGKSTIIAASWFWITGGVLGLTLVVPGALILVAPAAMIFTITAGVFVFFERKASTPNKLAWLFVVPATVLLVFLLPVLDFAETGLGFAVGGGFSGIAALLALAILTPMVGSPTPFVPRAAMLGLFIVGGTVWASLSQTHSQALPRPLNIQHWHSAALPIQTNNWVLSPSGKSAPKAINAVTPFSFGDVPGAFGSSLRSKAPPRSTKLTTPTVTLISETSVSDQLRRVRMSIKAPGADQITVGIPKEVGLRELSAENDGNGAIIRFDPTQGKGLNCTGRSCAVWEIEALISKDAVQWTFSGIARGLPAEAEPLRQARPIWASPIHGGDVRVTTVSIKI